MNKISIAASIILVNLSFAADEQNLNSVIINNNENDISEKRVGETIKDSKTLRKQQVDNIKDLVKYETGIEVIEKGRQGSSGYAIRGVDENRVSITIDGLKQNETLDSQGFKNLFEGYGNFNNTKNGVEVETLKQAKIVKGADSIKTGSGSLGGSVIFETKDARDYLSDSKKLALEYKGGYGSKNSEFTNSLALATKLKWFDILFIKTIRNGHEIKNFGFDTYENRGGATREKADPFIVKKDSNFIKFGINFNDNNRISAVYDNSKAYADGIDESYILNPSKTSLEDVEAGIDRRHSKDTNQRTNFGLSFENYDQNIFYDTLKVNLNFQKISNTTNINEYCSIGDCELTDPNGLNYKSENGNNVLYTKNETKIEKYEDDHFVDSQGNKLLNIKTIGLNGLEGFFNCSIIDCNAKIPILDQKQKSIEYAELDKPENGYAKIKDEKYTRDAISYVSFKPTKLGYIRDNWKKRELNTKTKQIKLDLSKEIEISNILNQLEYGISISKDKREMINRSGYSSLNVKWWAILQKEDPDKPLNKTETPETFLLPIITDNKFLYIKNNINLNDNANLNIGYGYDITKYTPNYTYSPNSNKAKLPKQLIEKISGRQNNSYIENIKFIQNQIIKFKNNSYILELNLRPKTWLSVSGKYSNGFRNPSQDEIYFTFNHPDFSIFPNFKLKPEKAINKELEIITHSDLGFIDLSIFKTNYTNFIDLALDLDSLKTGPGGGQISKRFGQNINRSNAEVNGYEINSRLNIGHIIKKLDNFYIGYKFNNQKGKIQTKKDGLVPMNAISPKTQILQIGYSGNNFGFDIYLKDVAAKEAKDTYNIFFEHEKTLQEQNGKPKEPNTIPVENYINKKLVTDYRSHWLSDAYKVLDLITYYKPFKNLTLRFGAYNITNSKYITWQSARSIQTYGTANRIRNFDGLGINRFNSPGRNFKLNIEYKY